VSKAIIPFEISSGNDFFEVAQFLVNVVSAKELLPHATTIFGNPKATATVLGDSVLKEVRDVFSGVSEVISLDPWSAVCRELYYFANGKLDDRVLCK
jgi:hypothetical protein